MLYCANPILQLITAMIKCPFLKAAHACDVVQIPDLEDSLSLGGGRTRPADCGMTRRTVKSTLQRGEHVHFFIEYAKRVRLAS